MKKDKLKIKITIQIEKNGQHLEPTHGNQLIQEFELEEKQSNESIWFSAFTLLNGLPFKIKKSFLTMGIKLVRNKHITFKIRHEN
ncbi:hypothetical protein B0A56_00765 [Flavobacterium columnare NBRC 100251 = ATCC 23463]|nr:hypothetical protein B0A56_00765 [Flavobacterium columnare NBRC 100251 = ATCC 23463]